MVIGMGAGGCTEKSPYREPPARSYSSGEFVVAARAFTDTVKGAMVSPAFADSSGMQAELGRFFVAGDYESAGARVVVISHNLWVRRFGSDPALIGSKVRINEREAIIVGVVPGGFAFPKGTDVWVPWIQR
jgi:hypothetical protein